MWRRIGRWSAVLVVAFLIVAQLVPYGRYHVNPPARSEPAWGSPQARELVVRACFDCHSNEVVWPWYAEIAPISWLVARDVDVGRAKLNFSSWDQPQGEAEECVAAVSAGEMPPWSYTLLHPRARLSPGERDQLVLVLAAITGVAAPARGRTHD